MEYPENSVVNDTPEDNPMDPGSQVPGQRRPFFEHSHWHHWFLGDVFLDYPESNHAENTDDQRNNHAG